MVRLKDDKICTEAHTTNSALWPVPYQCAQPYHPGGGSHGHRFRPGFAMLIGRKKDETAFHCYHYRGDMAVRIGKELAITRSW